MCGIAGFSLNPDEQVNAKRLARAMLLEIESRGWDATGFAFRDSTGQFQVHKNNSNASWFVKRRLCLPKNAQTCILHTRFATQGAPEWNDNNHPIRQYHVVGVHNGHVNNDRELFREIDALVGNDGVKGSVRIADVDSEAIFAALGYLTGDTAQTLDVLEKVSGAAAIAWLDDEDDDANTLHLARLSGSPLIIGETAGGSLLFGSTVETVRKGAEAVGLELKMVRDIAEGQYVKVVNGTYIDVRTFTPKRTFWTSKAYNGQRKSYMWDNDYDFYHPNTTKELNTPGTVTSLDQHLAQEDDEDYEWVNVGNGQGYWTFKDDEAEDYAQWWEENLVALDQAIEDDGDDRRETNAARFGRWQDAPRLNAYYLDSSDLRIPRPTEVEYLADAGHLARDCEIERWLQTLRCDDDDKQEAAVMLRAGVRPGDGVMTEVNGVRVPGHIYEVPRTFPAGRYIIRVLLPAPSANKPYGRYDCVFVSRTYWEFDPALIAIGTKPTDEVDDLIARHELEASF